MKYKVTYKNKTHIVDANSVQEAKDKVKLLDANKTVDKYDYDEELNRVNRTVLGRLVRITNLAPGWAREEKPIKMGVAWGAIGEVSTGDAKNFIRDLEKAVKEADNFKYNGCTITYGKK